MNVQETLAIIEALKASGASHFKSQDFEITLGLVPQKLALTQQHIDQLTPEQVKATEQANEKIKDLINTMKMTPEQLADQIFPAGAGG